MRSPPPESEADIPGGLRAALAASGVVGAWVHDIWADRLVVSAPVARAVGWPPEAGARGVPLAQRRFSVPTHGRGGARLPRPVSGPAGRPACASVPSSC